jgi:hypothetical protein
VDDTSQLARTKIAEATTIANLFFNILKSPFFYNSLILPNPRKKIKRNLRKNKEKFKQR